MKNELLKPGDIIEIKDNHKKYTCIVANIDGAYRLISLNDGYDFMVEEDGHDFILGGARRACCRGGYNTVTNGSDCRQ